MGPEDISEQIEWECKRVAAAFRVEQWEFVEGPMRFHGGIARGIEPLLGALIHWDINRYTGTLTRLEAMELEKSQLLARLDLRFKRVNLYLWEGGQEVMAQGLYCLGIDDEGVLAQLPTLSAHEQLELRLSMSREFWPQKWLDEEADW
ncbi:hypothetical protein IAD21_02011 [Abditibacteriota bacterium]|nr:hypothetical protein IAD21_02011 [Abditibacteriota bacterium]